MTTGALRDATRRDHGELGTCLREVRKRRRITQTRLAERAGTSAPYISMLENGRRDPRWSTLTKICKALGLRITIEDEAG